MVSHSAIYPARAESCFAIGADGRPSPSTISKLPLVRSLKTADGEGDGEGVGVWEGVGVLVGVGEAAGVCEGVGLGFGVGLGVPGVEVGVGVGEAAGVGVGVAAGVGVGVGDGVGMSGGRVGVEVGGGVGAGPSREKSSRYTVNGAFGSTSSPKRARTAPRGAVRAAVVMAWYSGW